jgi:hypothetical protein
VSSLGILRRPSLYAALLALAESTIAETFAGVRLCVSAGEFLDSSVRDGWRQRAGLQILDGLGSTECLHIFITSRPRDSGGESAGEVVEGIEARLLDEGEQEVGPGEIGHLWVKSPANAARYWNKHDESMATMHGPWTRTGDELLQDEGGFFHYVGRSDDIIEVGGMKVAPAEVEVALLQHPAVEQCAVVGTWEEGKSTVIAYVCLADGHEGDPATTRSLALTTPGNRWPGTSGRANTGTSTPFRRPRPGRWLGSDCAKRPAREPIRPSVAGRPRPAPRQPLALAAAIPPQGNQGPAVLAGGGPLLQVGTDLVVVRGADTEPAPGEGDPLAPRCAVP